jgi:hypothetical protein
MKRVLAPVLFPVVTAALFFWLMVVGPFAWILRDGLGPNAMDSSGLRAIQRFFLTFWWGPVSLLLGTLFAATLAWVVRVPSSPQEDEG